MAKPAKWTCNECGATGEAPVRAMALAAFTAHYGDAHNSVPWMDDKP
jgi:hypothetical protein